MIGAFQRVGGWCEPAPKITMAVCFPSRPCERPVSGISSLARLAPLKRHGFDGTREEIIAREGIIIRVVPRNMSISSLKLHLQLQGLFVILALLQKENRIMRRIMISDITMKQSAETSGFALSFREKIELAKQLDKLGVDVIEVSPIVDRRIDTLLIKSLASAVKDSVIAVPLTSEDENAVSVAWNALKEARKPRLQVVVPVSTVQMEYLCHKKPAAILDMIRSLVAQCKALGCETEFVAEDASRSEQDFLRSAIDAAVESGADIVTVCDTAGTMLPDEFRNSVRAIRDMIPAHIRLGIRCSNELFIAESCAMAAVQAGADEVKAAACGGFTAALDKLTHILKIRGEADGIFCDVRATELQRGIAQIRRMCEMGRSKSSAFDGGTREEQSDLELTVHDDLSAVLSAAAKLGYDLSEEDGAKVYEAFCRIAAKKESVGAKELDAIVASAALQVPPTYRLENYVVNAGNSISATCHMQLYKNDQLLESVCIGDGPVDASFLAIEQIVGRHYELDEFQIRAVTEGREAMGETVVRLRAGGKIYAGRGISTDVIGAGIRAYINAVNKIVYEEAEA